MFQHLLHKEAIKVGLEAGQRDEALAELLDILPEWGFDPNQRQDVLKRLIAREEYGTTAIGDGIALPRVACSGIEFPVLAVGISQEGVEYPSLDGKRVHLLFLLILPEKEDQQQEKERVLGGIHGFCSDRFMRELLKNSEDSEKAYEVMMADAYAVTSVEETGT